MDSVFTPGVVKIVCEAVSETASFTVEPSLKCWSLCSVKGFYIGLILGILGLHRPSVSLALVNPMCHSMTGQNKSCLFLGCCALCRLYFAGDHGIGPHMISNWPPNVLKGTRNYSWKNKYKTALYWVTSKQNTAMSLHQVSLLSVTGLTLQWAQGQGFKVPNAVVPGLFWAMDQFNVRQYFHRPSC